MKLAVLTVETTSPLTSCVAYPSDFFSREMPSAVTTTSSRPTVSGSMITLITVRPSIATSCGFMPMKENTSVVASAGTDREYLPSASVEVPTAVPFTMTVTAGSVPSPSVDEVTVPVITLVCAIRADAPSTKKTKYKSNFFISFTFRLVYKKKLCRRCQQQTGNSSYENL